MKPGKAMRTMTRLKATCDHPSRRTVVAGALVLVAGALHVPARPQDPKRAPDPRWYEAAVEMKRLAESWGDQPYGAVIVLDEVLAGQGPSRVVKSRDPDAHAEREAIRDAQTRLGRQRLPGAVLYSTSRPCSVCEAAAARAGVSRMFFGALLTEAGIPAEPK